jgi:hypothetical protein
MFIGEDMDAGVDYVHARDDNQMHGFSMGDKYAEVLCRKWWRRTRGS